MVSERGEVLQRLVQDEEKRIVWAVILAKMTSSQHRAAPPSKAESDQPDTFQVSKSYIPSHKREHSCHPRQNDSLSQV